MFADDSCSDELKNTNFHQLSDNHVVNIAHLIRANAKAAELLFFLVKEKGVNTNAVVCSYELLMERMCVSRSTVSKAVKYLKDNNWIDIVRIGNASAYCVNERVFWKSDYDSRKYAYFSATVIARGSEQPKGYNLPQPDLLPIMKSIPFPED